MKKGIMSAHRPPFSEKSHSRVHGALLGTEAGNVVILTRALAWTYRDIERIIVVFLMQNNECHGGSKLHSIL